MKRIRISESAERDLDEIWYFVATQSSSTVPADRLIDSITETFALLARAPEAGTRRDEIDPGVRGFPVGNYIVYYRDSGRSVDISRVLHGMRDQRLAWRDSESS